MHLFSWFTHLSRFNKTILVLVLGFFALFVTTRILQASRQKPPKFTTVQPGDIKETLTLSGTMEASERVSLGFQASGQLTWLGVKEGDTVQKYQAIASLDIRQMQKTLEKYLNTYMKYRMDFEQTKDDYTDTSELGLTQEIRDRAKRILEKSQFDLNNAVSDVEFQQLTSELATLVSPIDGIVTHVTIPASGINILVTQQPFEIVNPKTLYFEVKADQTEVVKLSLTQKASIILDAFPDSTCSGEITYISFVPKEGETGTVYPIHVTIGCANISSDMIRLGMTGDAAFTLSQKSNTLTVPIQYVKSDEKGKYVFISKDKRKAYVETGIENDEHIEIIKGLKAGDRIYD